MNKYIIFSLWLLGLGVIGTLILMATQSIFGIVNTFVGLNIIVAIAGVAVILLQVDKYLKRRIPKWVHRSPYHLTKEQKAYIDEAMVSMKGTGALNYFYYALSKREDTIITHINKIETSVKFTYVSFLFAYSETIRIGRDYENDWEAAYTDAFAVDANTEDY